MATLAATVVLFVWADLVPYPNTIRVAERGVADGAGPQPPAAPRGGSYGAALAAAAPVQPWARRETDRFGALPLHGAMGIPPGLWPARARANASRGAAVNVRWTARRAYGAMPAPARASAPRRAAASRTKPTWLCLDGRQAPSIFIVGCQKCGTTSLLAQMEKTLSWQGVRVQTGHAYRDEPPFFEKEKHFFSTDRIYAKGRRFYLNHFPPCSRQHAAIVDATPNYLNVPQAPRRLKEMYGAAADNLTFVLILRDPAERTESYFYHARADGWLHQPWEGAPPVKSAQYHLWTHSSLRQAAACAARGVRRLWPECDVWGLFVSLYAQQLAEWLRFFRADQFIVVPMSRYLDRNREVMADLARRLGLALAPGESAPARANKRKAKKSAADAITTKALRAFFAPHNREFTDLLKRAHVHVSPDGRFSSGDLFFERA